MQVEAVYRLVYHLNPNAEFSEDSLEDFARINALFNVWPYWREFIASTFNRMGYRHAGMLTMYKILSEVL